MRNLTRFLAIFVLAIGIGLADAKPAHAMIVHDPVSMAKSVFEWAKNHVAQAKQYLISAAQNNNIVRMALNQGKMFLQQTKNDEANKDAIVQGVAAAGLGMMNATLDGVDVQTKNNQVQAAGVANAQIQNEASDVAAAYCPAASSMAREEDGGIANPDVLGSAPRLSGAGPGFVQPRINWGPYRAGRRGADGKPIKVSRAAATSAFTDQAGVDRSLANTNTIGTQGAQGPLQYYNDQVDWFFRYFCSEGAYGGAMKGLCEAAKNNPNKAGLDTRAGDFLAGSENTQSFSCFTDGIAGHTTLGRLSISKCPRDKKWEDLYGQPMSEDSPIPVISLDAAHVIKDYLTPAPLPNFSRNFIVALARHDSNATEVFAKRQSFNSTQALAVGIFDQVIARRTPQALSNDQVPRWIADYKAVRPHVPDNLIPRAPSQMLMRDVALEKYRNANTFKGWGALNMPGALAKLVEIQAQQLASQKDLLYSLERIEILLAGQMASNLREQRDDIAREVERANSSAGNTPAASGNATAQ